MYLLWYAFCSCDSRDILFFLTASVSMMAAASLPPARVKAYGFPF